MNRLDPQARWWAWSIFVALATVLFAAAAFVIGQPLAGVTLLLLAGQRLTTRYLQLQAFRDGWHTANCVPRSSRRPLEPWEPIPPPVYPEPPTRDVS